MKATAGLIDIVRSPHFLRRAAAHIIRMSLRPMACIPGLKPRRCVMCRHRVGWFQPYEGGWRRAPRLVAALDVIGSDLDHFSCPRCGAHDRERHLLLYLRASGLLADLEGKSVLHFAPERHLSQRIADAGPGRYVKCDLFPSSDDIIRVDMLDIPFGTETFDLVVANHVLEHVDDDKQAVAELRRVLKIGGHAILQTPFSAALTRTWEDPGITTSLARIQAYGQDDHVRLFGRDIVERIEAAGLAPRVRNHDDLLPATDADEFGVNRAEPFLLFQRVI